MMNSAWSVARPNAHFQYFGNALTPCVADFELTTLGVIHVPAGAQYPPPGHPAGYAYRWSEGRKLAEYQVHFITRGLGSLQTDVAGSSQHMVLPGSTFILFPKVWHRYAPVADTGWTEYWIGLRGRRVDELIRSRALSEHDPQPLANNLQQLSLHFARAVSTLESDDVMSSEIRRALATLILSDLNPAPKLQHFPQRSPVEKAVLLLHETSATRLKLDEIAQRLNVGYHTLRQRFKKEMGCTMNQVRDELRLKRAAIMLRGSVLAVKEVAVQCGFEDPYYFSRAFRKRFGKSPKRYRTQFDGR